MLAEPFTSAISHSAFRLAGPSLPPRIGKLALSPSLSVTVPPSSVAVAAFAAAPGSAGHASAGSAAAASAARRTKARENAWMVIGGLPLAPQCSVHRECERDQRRKSRRTRSGDAEIGLARQGVRLLGLQKRIMAEHHDDAPLLVRERQTQPELEYARLIPGRERNDALCGTAGANDLVIGRVPVIRLVAEIVLVEIVSGDQTDY